MLSHRTWQLGLLILSITIGSVPFQAYAANSALMELIQILKNKGSITEAEYQLLQKAAAEDETPAVAAAQPAITRQADVPITAVAAKPASSNWTDSVALKGDIRLRYQNEQEKPGAGRDRTRIRYRLGVSAQPTAGWEIGGGLATGPADPRSTNQTFTESFSKKAINLDYGYAQYLFNDHLKLIGGKFRTTGYLYTVSDLLYDTDINPEGISANFTYSSDFGSSFANTGLWVMEEKSASDKDPYLAYLQLGQSYSSDSVFASLAGTYYSFEDNTTAGAFPTTGANTDFEFSGIYSLSGELGLHNLIGEGPRVSLIADLLENSDTDTSDEAGYLLGFKGTYALWSFRYNYARLDRNSWPDFLPDADRYSGRTGIRGHEFLVEYAIMKNVLLAVNYYLSEQDTTGFEQDLLQLDLNVKF